jgi:two-component sensor histidine kinase
MREINHRAKNMLSVVDAIAHQTASRNREDFVERFSERIQALSANQDLLVRNEWNGVEIEDLVRAQLALFADLIGSRIAVHGPRLRLNEGGLRASHWARAPRACHQRWEIRGALDGYGSRRYLLGDRW